MWLAHRKIGYRLASGFGIVVILALILGLFALARIHILAELTVKMYEHPLTVSNAVRDIRAEILAMHRTMKDVALAEDAEQVNAAMKVVDTCEQEVFKSFDIISERFLGGPEKVQKARKAFADWKIIREQVSELMRQGKQRETEAITQGKGHEHVDYMIRTIDVMSDFASAKADELYDSSQQIRKQQIFWMTGLLAAVLITSTFVSVFISRSIANPISRITAEVKHFAEGEFDRRISIESRDEIGGLASEFNHMASELERTTTSVSNLNNEIGRRKQTEQGLKESEKKFRAVVETAVNAIISSDSEGKIIFWNVAAEKMFGYAREEIIGKEVKTIIPERYHSAHLKGFKRVVETGKTRIVNRSAEMVGLRKDGTEFPLELILSKWQTEEGVFFTVIISDITERKQAEEALRKSEELFSNQFEVANIGLSITSIDKGWIRVNKTLCEILGYSEEELKEKTWSEMTHPDDLESDIKQFEKILDGEIDIYNLDKRFIRKDGNNVYTHLSIGCVRNPDKTVNYLVASLEDITERKKAEEEIKQAKEQYETLVSNMPEAIYSALADEKGTSIFMSKRWGQWTGYSTNDPEIWQKSIHPDDRERTVKVYLEAAKEKKDYIIDYRVVHKDTGEVRWVSDHGSPIIDEKGNVVSFDGTITDITERKQAEETLKDKTKEMETLLRVVSHDLRAPLVNIQGFSKELMADCQQITEIISKTEMDEQTKNTVSVITNECIPESTNFIQTSVRKMDTLLKALSHLAKVGTVKLDIQPLDINAIVGQVIDTMKFSARKANATIELETLPACLGDEVQIDQIFSNLIGNAIKYLDPDRPGRIRIWGKVEGNLSQYCVEDNGVGIPDYHKPKVFEIFHRVDPEGSASGDGLGLTTSKQIVERHKGCIWLESEPGKGSKFFVSLPTVKA